MIEQFFQGFSNFIQRSIDYDIKIVDDTYIFKDLINFLGQYIDQLEEFEDHEDLIAWLEQFDKILWCTFVFERTDFNRLISKTWGRQWIGEDAFITSKLIQKEAGSSLVIYEFIRYNAPKSRKTLEEVQNELERAIEHEEYEKAAELQAKIEKLIQKRKQEDAKTSR